ncbi:MAG: TPM domain-containing protein [Oscillospiraceae bacterium]|nr:TPM domain-containing protein [Oscillospiraceae bacterium]
MTKKIVSLIFAFVLVFGISVSAFAATGDVAFDKMVIDYPDILSSEEEAELENRAWKLTKQYHCGVYIMITDTLGGMEAWEFNEMVYDELNLGYGSERSAIVLLISTGERQYDIMAHGYGNTVFTDYGKDIMAERFVDNFGNDDWYGGFCDYIDTCDEFFAADLEGEPVDVGTESSGGIGIFGVFIAIILACVIAMAICLILRAQMKTARKATEAHKYAKDLALSRQYDRFSHRDVIRRYNPPSDNDSGGTTVNSGGFSHKSGGF